MVESHRVPYLLLLFVAASLPESRPEFSVRPVDFESREAPEGELRFDVSSCQYARFFQEIGEPELGFLLVCSADAPIAEGLGIGFERSQTLMQGGSHCDFRYILAPPESSAPDQ
jgi:hypothetical protein